MVHMNTLLSANLRPAAPGEQPPVKSWLREKWRGVAEIGGAATGTKPLSAIVSRPGRCRESMIIAVRRCAGPNGFGFRTGILAFQSSRGGGRGTRS